VSPQNVIVGADGASRLIDFGIAKAASRITVTNSGVFKGKLRYMSPEQVKQKPIDRRSDVFAAGVVLYEALTGQRPFGGEDDGDVVISILLGEFAPPSSLCEGIPPALDRVVERALAGHRDERFQTAQELEEAIALAVPPASPKEIVALVEAHAGETLRERRASLRAALEEPAAPPSTEITSAPADKEVAPAATFAERKPRRSLFRPWMVASAVVAAAGGGIAFVALRAGAEPAPSVASPASSASGEREAAPTVTLDGSHAQVTGTSVTVPPDRSAAPVASSVASAPPRAVLPSRRSAPARSSPPSDLHRQNPYGPP
jgi:serine/threonine-protein kinase